MFLPILLTLGVTLVLVLLLVGLIRVVRALEGPEEPTPTPWCSRHSRCSKSPARSFQFDARHERRRKVERATFSFVAEAG